MATIYCFGNLFRSLLQSQGTTKVASTQVVEMSVANNSPSWDSNQPDDRFKSRYVTPGFKSFFFLYTEYCISNKNQTGIQVNPIFLKLKAEILLTHK